jgi:tripartite-type tricarboxylate transporter receptor subunit TctC
MNTRRNLFRLAFVFGGTSIIGAQTRAADIYPNRGLRMIVPHPAGGGVDILARPLSAGMGAILGQTVIVDNKPGANGMIGAQIGASSVPDGYTLMMNGPGEIAIAPHLYRSMVYDPARDLAPLTLCAKVPNVLVVGPATAANNVAELISAAKANPGAMTFGSSGVGNIQHLNGELFNKLAGVQIRHIPYKGAAPQMADIVGGQIQMGFMSIAAALPMIKSGRLRPLAITSRTRMAALPDVPTLSETPALVTYDLDNWFGLFVPSKTPKTVIATLHNAAVKILNTEEMRKSIQNGGAVPAPDTPEAFASFISSQSKIYGQIIKDVGIKADT